MHCNCPSITILIKNSFQPDHRQTFFRKLIYNAIILESSKNSFLEVDKRKYYYQQYSDRSTAKIKNWESKSNFFL